ncbi:putative copper resistance protein D [Paucimonas lemoignei]|uniref:Putative copper resistance protein D n=1 Tax=Paucimonas lemoignei TaxID=29443 RepID=A0A4R3HU85_PAULE|nr:CopD family protein [Paucimonas lemoignei]TCS33115.1 putative copper resistance protein D [Paucimonas lemoignei]
MEATLPQIASTALINFSLSWTAGILASRFWLRKRTASWQDGAAGWLASAMTVSLVMCLLGILLSLWSESAAMADVAWLDAWPAFQALVATTHYGHAGIAAATFFLLALILHWLFKRRHAELHYLGVIAFLVLLAAGARVTIGHAYAYGFWSVAVMVEWLHLLAMALWTGMVLVAGWAVLPRVLAMEFFPSQERASYLASMSTWATAVLAALLATGAYNAYRVLSSPRDLLATDYGHMLVFKLACVGIAIALGGFNRFAGLPAALSTLATSHAQHGLQTVVAVLRIESVALLLALAAAAVMTSSAPPVH